LDTPIRQLAYVQVIFGSTVDCVYEAELFELLSGGTELPDNASIQLQLEDRRVVHAVFVACV